MGTGTHQGWEALWMVQKGGGQVDVDVDVDGIHAGPGGGGARHPGMALDDEN